MGLDLLEDFLNWEVSGRDDDFIDHLVEGIPPTSAQNANPFSLLYQYISRQRHKSSNYVIEKLLAHGHACFCHPPYSREYFLGPEVLHIATGYLRDNDTEVLEEMLYLGASLDYTGHDEVLPKTNALQAVVNRADTKTLRIMIKHQNCIANPEVALFAALKQAKTNFATRHPRSFEITKVYPDVYQDAGGSYRHSKTKYTVHAKNDAGCCVLLTKALKELGCMADLDCKKYLGKFYEAFGERDWENTFNSNWRTETETDWDNDLGYIGSNIASGSKQVSNGRSEQVVKGDGVSSDNELDIDLSQPGYQVNPRSPRHRSTPSTIRPKGERPIGPLQRSIFVAKTWLRIRYGHLIHLTSLDIFLVMVGLILSMQFMVEYAFWEFVMWTVNIPQPSRVVTLFIFVLLLGIILSSWWA
jgi:hypothetical protein